MKAHAAEMYALQSNPALYTFVPHDPLTLSDLETRYEKWQVRRSPFGNELWLNWIARVDSRVIGHFQAGVQTDGSATLAYTVGKEFQKQGFAFEALSALIVFLKNQFGTKKTRAWVDTRNTPSIELLKKLGFSQIEHLPNADFFKGEKSDEYVFELNYLGGVPAICVDHPPGQVIVSG
jgi:ribosomal-protein-alanine N-acetyltransferase